MKKLLLIGVSILLLCSSTDDRVQLNEKNTPAIIKASYVYNFAKLVGWPDKKSNGNFTIGILGDSDLYKQIVEKYSGKKIGGQNIEIIQLLNSEQLPELHILYISRLVSDKLEGIAPKLKKNHTMIISEQRNGLANGATINFLVIDNLQKFEINETTASAQGLTIGSTLKSLAHNLVK